MAYHATTGIALNTADFLVKLKTYLEGTAGWTTVDDRVTTGATTQDTVISSVGESGNENIILHIRRNNANGITVTSVLSWNAGTHVAQKEVGSTSATAGTGTYIPTDDNNYFQYWIFTSLDRIIVVTRVGYMAGFSAMLYAGIYNRQRAATFRTTTGAITAGTAVVVAFADTTIFAVGRRYALADTTNYEFPKVTAINPGVSVTLDIVQNSYVTGARLGEDVRPTIISPSPTAAGVNLLGSGQATWWGQALPFDGGLGLMTTGGVILRRMDPTMVERTTTEFGDGGPDGGGSGSANLWPFFVSSEADFDGALLGTLMETFQVSRRAALTGDTITIGGSTYTVINGAAMVTATGDTAFAVAVRTT